MEKMIEVEHESQPLGLCDAKHLPFYELLEQALPDDDEQGSIIDLSEIITEIIQDHAVIDWTEKEDVKREMRKRMKKTAPCKLGSE